MCLVYAQAWQKNVDDDICTERKSENEKILMVKRRGNWRFFFVFVAAGTLNIYCFFDWMKIIPLLHSRSVCC